LQKADMPCKRPKAKQRPAVPGRRCASATPELLERAAEGQDS